MWALDTTQAVLGGNRLSVLTRNVEVGMAPDVSALKSVDAIAAWVDEYVPRLAAEDIPLDAAVGRVLAQDVAALVALPPLDWAAVDGVAVRADETVGASIYNPLSFRLVTRGGALPANTGLLVSAGDPLPGGADAIVALNYVQQDRTGHCEIIETVASGTGVERRGSQLMPGTKLIEAGRSLHPPHIGLLAAAGVQRLPAVRCPRVHCLLLARTNSGDKTEQDAKGPLLQALVGRDGGTVVDLRYIARDPATIGAALTEVQSDAIIVAGGTGRGTNDVSAAALAEIGELAGHGVTLYPGDTAGFGRIGARAPVFLLPGAPVACLWAYEFLAGRAIRRLGGRDTALPFRAREMMTVRKIVSRIGTTEVCSVRCLSRDQLEPHVSFNEAGLGAVAMADGFVIIPEGSEGFPEGAIVTAYLWDG